MEKSAPAEPEQKSSTGNKKAIWRVSNCAKPGDGGVVLEEHGIFNVCRGAVQPSRATNPRICAERGHWGLRLVRRKQTVVVPCIHRPANLELFQIVQAGNSLPLLCPSKRGQRHACQNR